VNLTAVRDLYDTHMRRDSEFSGSQRYDAPPLVRYVHEEGGYNVIRYSELHPDDADPIIQREIDFFTGIGQRFEWTVFDYDTQPDLRERLAAHGFRVGEEEAVLVLPTDAEINARPLAEGYTVRQITDPDAAIPILQTVQKTVFADNDFDPDVDTRVAGYLRDFPDTHELYAAFHGEQPVSAAWMDSIRAGCPFAGLYGGATLPEHRGKGVYTTLVAARAVSAQGRGVPYLTVDASPMSRPILLKLGFVQIGTAWPCHFKPSDTAASRGDRQ